MPKKTASDLLDWNLKWLSFLKLWNIIQTKWNLEEKSMSDDLYVEDNFDFLILLAFNNEPRFHSRRSHSPSKSEKFSS